MEAKGQEKIQVAIQDLIARLTRAALNQKDIPSYLRIHAPTTQQTLLAKGFVYYLRDPSGKLIPTLNQGADALKPYASILQEALADSTNKQTHETRMLESEGAPKLEAHWVPVQQDEALAGILLFWFVPLDEMATMLRREILSIAGTELSFFLKLQSSRTIPKERKRLIAYTHLLEALLDDLSLETIGWKLVNYARETLQCSRVCVFIAEGYEAQAKVQPSLNEEHFIIQACSGLKKVHPRSEQAVLLQDAAKALLELSAERGKSKATLAPVVAKRTPPPGSKARPGALIRYFEKTPMHWATAMPLYDAKGLLCGLLLFEGQDIPENLQLSLLRMHTLARAGRIILAKGLYWSKNKVLKAATQWSTFRHNLTLSRKRSLIKQSLFIVAATLAFLLIPLPYKIKGQATLTPKKQTILASKRIAVIKSIPVKPGQEVPEGGLLYTIDEEPTKLALAQAKKSYYRLHTEADRNRHRGNEAAMHQALIQAKEVATRIEQLKADLQDTAVYAPYNCVVLSSENLSLKKGEVVLPGEPILKIANLDTWIVRTELREQDVVALQNYLESKGPTTASLSLLAHPEKRFPLEFSSEQQLHYGEEPATDNYTYYAIFHFNNPKDKAIGLKEDYLGTVSVKAGWHSLAYILFHDFWLFIQARTS